MAIFPPFYPNYTDKAFDSLMNNGCGTILVLIFAFSVLLNIVAFYEIYTQQQFGIAKVLFMILILSDLVYSLVKDPYVVNSLLNPQIKADVPDTNATTTQMLVSELSWVAVHVSINSIFGLSILRFVSLAFPWWSIANTTARVLLVAFPMSVCAAYGIMVEILIMYHDRYRWSSTSQDLELDNFSLYVMPPVFIPAGLSLVFTVAVIIKLRVTLNYSVTVRHGTVTLLILSLGNLTWMVDAVWSAFTERMDPKAEAFSNFMAYVMIPSIMALYNPLVLFYRKTQKRQPLKRHPKLMINSRT